MFAMSRQLKGALMAAGGGVCWGISGTMGQYLFTHEAMQTTWLIPIRLSLAGLILAGEGPAAVVCPVAAAG